MTQWYPKMCEYDYEGWHSNPYIEENFHGVWGEYNVVINIDSSFILGGTGIIQNPNEIGYGYENNKFKSKKINNNKLKWNLKQKMYMILLGLLTLFLYMKKLYYPNGDSNPFSTQRRLFK